MGALGALYAGYARTLDRERQVMALCVLLAAVAVSPVGVHLGLAGLTLGLAIAGFLSGPIDVGVLTLRQRRTDPQRLGRVLAVSISLNMAGLPLGSALGGLLLTQSLDAAFAVAALACLLSALATYLLIPARPE